MKKSILILTFFLATISLWSQTHYGKILRLNTNGAMGWEDINSVLSNTPSTATNPSFWLLEGNSVSGAQFFGTTNAADLIFKTDNAERLRIAATGDITLFNSLFLANSGTVTQLRFYEPNADGTNYTSIQATTQAGDITYTLPAVTGINGQVLSIDSSGNLSWITGGSATGWGLTGNLNTVDGTNFIGTTNDVALNFKVNNEKAGRIGTDGDKSVFLGYQAGTNDDLSDNRNVFVGYQSGTYNTIGSNNTATGSNALFSNTSGSNNTANGYYALLYNSTGSNNVALGYNAGISAFGVNFVNCTFVGAESSLFQGRTNVTMLGYGIGDAQCTGDNQVLLGNTSVTEIRASVGSITTYSDGRYKTNIENNVHGLDFIMKLKPITYNVDPRKLHKIWGEPDSVIDKMDVTETMKDRRIGFIAQDVEKAANESGFAFPGIDIPKNEKEAYTLRYVDFIMPMVKSIQEQQTTIEQLQSENQILKEQLNLQQQQMTTMIQEIEKIKQEMANKEKDNKNKTEELGENK